MLDLVLKAVFTGFVLSIMIGPVFFLLLETSIRKGVKSAIAFDIGVLFSDIIYIGIAYFFYAKVAEFTTGDQSYIFHIFGGGIFIIFGVLTLLKKPKHNRKEEHEIASQRMDYLILSLKGFVLNVVNPAVIFYWFTVIAFGIQQTNSKDLGQTVLIYVSIIILTFFSIDLLKILGAKKLRPFINDRFLMILNRFTGALIVSAGVYMMIKGFHTYSQLS